MDFHPGATTDDETQHPPDPSVFEDAEPIQPELVELGLFELDDLDLYAEGIQPFHAGMLAIAVRQYRAGIREDPDGSNRGIPLERYVRWFVRSSGPLPWCAFFVSWCLDRATDANRRVPWTNPGYVLSIRQWAAGAGRLVSRPRSGDIFGIRGDHCGIVNNANFGSGRFSTVEGNYQDRVAAVSRPRSQSGLWFARI